MTHMRKTAIVALGLTLTVLAAACTSDRIAG
jgi:hypothetical protein